MYFGKNIKSKSMTPVHKLDNRRWINSSFHVWYFFFKVIINLTTIIIIVKFCMLIYFRWLWDNGNLVTLTTVWKVLPQQTLIWIVRSGVTWAKWFFLTSEQKNLCNIIAAHSTSFWHCFHKDMRNTNTHIHNWQMQLSNYCIH